MIKGHTFHIDFRVIASQFVNIYIAQLVRTGMQPIRMSIAVPKFSTFMNVRERRLVSLPDFRINAVSYKGIGYVEPRLFASDAVKRLYRNI